MSAIAAPVLKWQYGGCITPPHYCDTGWYASPAVADLDGDGKDEIVAGYRGPGTSLFIYHAKNDQGTAWERETLDTEMAASCLAIADINGDGRPDIVAIGSSTGGPQALRTILAALPKDLSVPLVLVQHIGRGFVQGLVDWLNGYSGPLCRVAQHGDELLSGHAYFAPDDHHLQVQRIGRSLMAVLKDTPPVDNIRPSATPLFRSVAACCAGNAVGVVLTGMGADGAEGLLEMHRAGCVTVVQDEESCVVNGMPAAARALGAAEQVLPLERIAPRLCRYAEMAIDMEARA